MVGGVEDKKAKICEGSISNEHISSYAIRFSNFSLHFRKLFLFGCACHHTAKKYVHAHAYVSNQKAIEEICSVQ